VTGTAVGDTVEYRVDRKRLRLRIGPDDDRKYLSLSAYAGNRVGRGPRTYFGGETAVLLRHPWWWQREGGPGPAEDGAGTKATTGLAATSSSGNSPYRLRFPVRYPFSRHRSRYVSTKQSPHSK